MLRKYYNEIYPNRIQRLYNNNDPTNVDLTSSYHYFLPQNFKNSSRKSR